MNKAWKATITSIETTIYSEIRYNKTLKCTRTERKFKVDFLENKASDKKFLFYIFDFFFRVESPPFRLYH